jgi:hypothetical protein
MHYVYPKTVLGTIVRHVTCNERTSPVVDRYLWTVTERLEVLLKVQEFWVSHCVRGQIVTERPFELS